MQCRSSWLFNADGCLTPREWSSLSFLLMRATKCLIWQRITAMQTSSSLRRNGTSWKSSMRFWGYVYHNSSCFVMSATHSLQEPANVYNKPSHVSAHPPFGGSSYLSSSWWNIGKQWQCSLAFVTSGKWSPRASIASKNGITRLITPPMHTSYA